MVLLSCSGTGGIYAKLANGAARGNCARTSLPTIQWLAESRPSRFTLIVTLFITQCATTGVTLTKKSGRRLSASVLIVEINPITLSGSA